MFIDCLPLSKDVKKCIADALTTTHHSEEEIKQFFVNHSIDTLDAIYLTLCCLEESGLNNKANFEHVFKNIKKIQGIHYGLVKLKEAELNNQDNFEKLISVDIQNMEAFSFVLSVLHRSEIFTQSNYEKLLECQNHAESITNHILHSNDIDRCMYITQKDFDNIIINVYNFQRKEAVTTFLTGLRHNPIITKFFGNKNLVDNKHLPNEILSFYLKI